MIRKGLSAEDLAIDARAASRYPLKVSRVTVERWATDAHAVDPVYAHAVWLRHPTCPLRMRGTKRWVTKAQADARSAR